MAETVADVFEHLKQTCVFIVGPDGTGTGYLIAPQRIATALHVVKSWQPGKRYPVIVGVGGPARQATLLKADANADCAVLGFEESVDVGPLPVAQGVKRQVEWEGYGFPALAGKTEQPPGLPIDGQVKDPRTRNDIGQPAMLLYSDAVAAGNASPLHGFSGSPVVVDGALVGHLTKHIGDSDDKRRAAYGYVYACPIDEVIKLLDVEPAKRAIAPAVLATRVDAVPQIDKAAYHVFVSYRATDRPWALGLVARLEGAGLRVFIDQRELVPGQDLAAQLESALQRSRAAVVLVSKGWLASPWCQQEAGVLKKRAIEDKNFCLVPLRLDDSPMPPFLDARVWLDFSGSHQAEGPNLDRLLNALLGRATEPENSPVARANAADVRVTDKFVAEIRSAAKGDGKQIFDIIAEWRKTASADLAPLIAAAEAFNGKGFFESTLQILADAPATLRVRQLRALATRKMGKIDEAIALLEELSTEGQLDQETGGLLAGSYKARWLIARDPAFCQLAYDTYRSTYERTGDPFNGINTASMALHCGDQLHMAAVAAQVRDYLLKRDATKFDHWDLATLGEAHLLLKRPDDARDWYKKAAGKAAGLHENIAVMRRQARLNLEALGLPRNQLDAVLPVPRVLVYFGHMVDAENRPVPRFPKEKIGALRQVIRERLQKYGALHGFGQASRGTDMIVLEELVRRDLTANVVLPIPRDDFLALSVGGSWKEHFARLEKNQRIEFLPPLFSPCPPPDVLTDALTSANREVQRLAMEFSRRLDEEPVILAVWDGRKGDGPGGTADAITLWRDEGYEKNIDVIDINTVGAPAMAVRT